MTTDERIKKAKHHFKSGWMYTFKPYMISYDIAKVHHNNTYEVYDWCDAGVMRSSMNTWEQIQEFLTTGETSSLKPFQS